MDFNLSQKYTIDIILKLRQSEQQECFILCQSGTKKWMLNTFIYIRFDEKRADWLQRPEYTCIYKFTIWTFWPIYCTETALPARPTLLNFSSLKIRESMPLNIIKFADSRILRLLNCERVGREYFILKGPCFARKKYESAALIRLPEYLASAFLAHDRLMAK